MLIKRSIEITMTPMYQIIKELPLFKGLSSNQISNLLEKTPIDFSQYEKGDIVCAKNEEINTLKCLIGGSVTIRHSVLAHDHLVISETIEAPAIIEGEKLFGMNKTLNSDIECTEKASIMQLSKDQYLRLLQSDEIYLINYLNYLSIRAQSVSRILPNDSYRTFKDAISALVNSYVSRSASSVELKFSKFLFANYIGMEESQISKGIEDLEKQGLIRTIIYQDNITEGFVIPSKAEFLN